MEANESIAELLSMAKFLLERKGQFDFNPKDEEWEAGELGRIEETGNIAKRFFELVKRFQSNLSQYKYWDLGLDVPGAWTGSAMIPARSIMDRSWIGSVRLQGSIFSE
jgi:hypothetical protein